MCVYVYVYVYVSLPKVSESNKLEMFLGHYFPKGKGKISIPLTPVCQSWTDKFVSGKIGLLRLRIRGTTGRGDGEGGVCSVYSVSGKPQNNL